MERSKATVSVELDSFQLDLLRGIIFEYYQNNEYHDSFEVELHNELEVILADAENSFPIN